MYVFLRHGVKHSSTGIYCFSMLHLRDKNSRKGRYTNTVNLLRKYFGDFLIATYLEVLQDSRYHDAYIRGIEVCFSYEYVYAVLSGDKAPLRSMCSVWRSRSYYFLGSLQVMLQSALHLFCSRFKFPYIVSREIILFDKLAHKPLAAEPGP